MIGTTFIGELFDRLRSVWPLHIVKSGSAGVRYRRGIAADKSLKPGWYFAVWFFGEISVETVTPRSMNLPTQSETTTDGKTISYSANLLYEVTNLVKKQTRVDDFEDSIMALAMMQLAKEIRSREFEAIRAEREVIETRVRRAITKFARFWGVRVLMFGVTDFVEAQQLRHFGEIAEYSGHHIVAAA